MSQYNKDRSMRLIIAGLALVLLVVLLGGAAILVRRAQRRSGQHDHRMEI